MLQDLLLKRNKPWQVSCPELLSGGYTAKSICSNTTPWVPLWISLSVNAKVKCKDHEQEQLGTQECRGLLCEGLGCGSSEQSSPPPKTSCAVCWRRHVLPIKQCWRKMVLQAQVGKDKNLKVSANKLFYACTVFFEEAAMRFKTQLMAPALAQSV